MPRRKKKTDTDRKPEEVLSGSGESTEKDKSGLSGQNVGILQEKGSSGQSKGNGTKATTTAKAKVKADKESLTVDGSPYAPISIRKTIEHLQAQGHFDIEARGSGSNLTVLVNNSGNGFDVDNAETINVTIDARVEQTKYFIDHVFDKLSRIPAYLYRYIHWVMFEDCKKPMKYKEDNTYIQEFQSGLLKETDEEYQQVYNFIKWGKTNSEATHLIGLIQLVGGTMMARAKRNQGCLFYIELPETGFHPKRERLLVTLLMQLKEEYGYKEK